MKLITQYKKQEPILENIDIYSISIDELTSHQSEVMPFSDAMEVIEFVKEKGKKCYVLINRFVFEPEYQNAKQIIENCINKDIDGFIVNDFGYSILLEELNFKGDLILHTDTTMTNSLEAQVLFENGFDKVVVARELTFEEIIDMIHDCKEKVVVPIFGHQIISTSRRLLLDAYGDEVNMKFDSHRFYDIQESTREDMFLLYQDETGTHIFDGAILCGFEEFISYKDAGCEYFLLDRQNIEFDMLKFVSDKFKSIQTPEDAIRAQADFKESYPDVKLTKALWDKKTSDKKVDA